MAEAGQVFECESCGNVVKVTKAGTNRMIECCGKPRKTGK